MSRVLASNDRSHGDFVVKGHVIVSSALLRRLFGIQGLSPFP